MGLCLFAVGAICMTLSVSLNAKGFYNIFLLAQLSSLSLSLSLSFCNLSLLLQVK